MMNYNDPVKVSAESGELIGTARFVGTARKNNRSARWQWSGQLHDTSFDPNVLLNSGQLRLEFNDGKTGHAFCTNVTRNLRHGTVGPSTVALKGTDAPPGVETIE